MGTMLALEHISVINDLKGAKEGRNREKANKSAVAEAEA